MKLTSGVYLVGSGEIGLSDPWDSHVYLIDGGDELALIDAGCGLRDSVDQIIANIAADGLDVSRLRSVLLTHWHPDHAGGAHVWRDRFGLRIAGSATEQVIVEGGEAGLHPCPIDRTLVDGDEIAIGNVTLRAIEVAGHSRGSICFQTDLPAGRALFTGDVVFMNGILGLLNHPDSDLGRYRESFGRLESLGIDLLFPGHMLFFLRNGQTHIDRAADALRGSFVPYSVGQLGIDFRPPDRM